MASGQKPVPDLEVESPFGPDDFAARTGVSRETLARLKAYADILTDWNARHNLVAKSTLPDLWHRHFWDSAQLMPLIPAPAKTLADLGSGAGFPGLVLAAMRPDLAVTLHEATTKKCAFLQAAADRMGVAVSIRNARLEDLPRQAFDVVTARALAPRCPACRRATRATPHRSSAPWAATSSITSSGSATRPPTRPSRA